MKAIGLLADFIARHQDEHSFPNNEWLNGTDMEVYVRKSVPRILTGKASVVNWRAVYERHVTLDIGNVNVFLKGRGQFTKFLVEAEKLNPWPAIYLENVLESRLQNFVLRQGYIQASDVFPPSYYKMRLA